MRRPRGLFAAILLAALTLMQAQAVLAACAGGGARMGAVAAWNDARVDLDSAAACADHCARSEGRADPPVIPGASLAPSIATRWHERRACPWREASACRPAASPAATPLVHLFQRLLL